MSNPAKNDITGDRLISKSLSKEGEANWDRIFGKNKTLENSIKENKKIYESLAEYELNKSTGEVQKVDNGTTSNTQK